MCADHAGEDIAQFVRDLRQQGAGETGLRHRAQIAALVSPQPHGRAPAETPKALQGRLRQKIVDHHDRRIALAPADRDLPGIGGIDRRSGNPRARFQAESAVVDAVCRQPVPLFGIMAQLVRRIGLGRHGLVAQRDIGVMAIDLHAFGRTSHLAQNGCLAQQSLQNCRVRAPAPSLPQSRLRETLRDVEKELRVPAKTFAAASPGRNVPNSFMVSKSGRVASRIGSPGAISSTVSKLSSASSKRCNPIRALPRPSQALAWRGASASALSKLSRADRNVPESAVRCRD